MKLNDLDMEHLAAARPLPVFRLERGWRGVLAVLRARLARAWIGLYAAPPRRLPPML